MRFHNCAWVFSANAPGANPGGPVWDRPLRRRETVFVIRRRGGSQTRPLKPSPFQGEGGWPLGQTDEGDFLARTPPAGAPRGSPTQIKDRFWKPVGEGLAPPAGRSGTGPYEKPNPFRSRRPSEPHLSPTTTKARFQPGGETPKGCWKLSGSGDRTETSQLSHPRLCVDCQGGLIGGPRKWGS